MRQNSFGAYILSETKNGERIVSCGGRISTREGTAVEIYKKSTDKAKNLNLISKVVSSGHTTILEHHYFNIAFNNVSVFVEQFLIEFRLASFTIKSGRYVNFSKAGFNLPEEFSNDQKYLVSAFYKKMFRVYDELIQKGIPIEDARFVLPYGIKTNIYMSVNARELVHIICTMIYGRGSQYSEIKKLGLMLKTEIDKRYPNLIDSNSKNYLSSANQISNLDIEKLYVISLQKNDEPINFVNQKVQFLNKNTQKPSEILKNMADFLKIKDFCFENADDKNLKLLEHFYYTFEISNFSVISLKHYTRHRMQSLSTKSIAMLAFENKFVMPETIAKNKEAKEIFENALKENRAVFSKLLKDKVSPELMVYVMPHATATDFISTMNLRELLHFINLRSCNRAKWEIRNLATEMTKMLKSQDSEIFDNFGPSCVTFGFCPEGRLCCGKQIQMKEKFKNLQNL